MNENLIDNLTQTGSYFITSKWGILFALGIVLVLCYCLFCIVRFCVRRFKDARLRKSLINDYQRELQKVRRASSKDTAQVEQSNTGLRGNRT